MFRTMMGAAGAILTLAVTASAQAGPASPPLDADVSTFRALNKELVETHSAWGDGSCTLAAQRMSDRLKAAGYPESDLHLIIPPGHPNDGNLVAVYPGTDPKAKAVLMLAHIDVVAAKREDWARDPFTLVEEDGYFYGRGSSPWDGLFREHCSAHPNGPFCRSHPSHFRSSLGKLGQPLFWKQPVSTLATYS